MAYEQVQKPSSSFVPVQKKVSEFAPSASRVQAKDVTAGEQEQMPLGSTPATDANWLMKHPLFKGNQFLQREVAPASESESLESVEETLQRQKEGNESATPHSITVQAKLTIGEPGDKYEQEADRVASQVVKQINSPDAAQSTQGQSVQRQEEPVEELQAKPSISDLQRSPLPLEVQREAMPAEEFLQAKSILQRREAIAGGEASTDLESAINRARGSGQPLDAGLQQSMGQAMGADFSGVKVHTGVQSDELNQSIQAKAFTTGQDVFFRQGAYDPGSRGGQELIAHELTHVVQQGGRTGLTNREGAVERKIQRVYPADTKSAANRDRNDLTTEVGVDEGQHGVKWFRDKMGNFGYFVVPEQKERYEASELKNVCSPGVGHSELWWDYRNVKLPPYNQVIKTAAEKGEAPDPYVYHITDKIWLSNFLGGFKSAYKRTGEKVAQKGGSTVESGTKNAGKQVASSLIGYVSHVFQQIVNKTSPTTMDKGKMEAWCNYILTTQGKKLIIESIELEGVDEDLMERVNPAKEEMLNKYIEWIYEQKNSPWADEQSPKEGSRSQGGKKGKGGKASVRVNTTQLRQVVSKLVEDIPIDNHYLKDVAVAVKGAEQKKEEIVTSQYVYVFRKSDAQEALNLYAKNKSEPVVLRMKPEVFENLAQDSQAGGGMRSRDTVDAEHIEYYLDGIDQLKTEWFGNAKKEEGRWESITKLGASK